jgi:CRISPR-associated protein Cas5t
MKLLEISFEGWTATPRMPFILSGNSLCMPTPSYSILLGILGCCLGRLITHEEVNIGFFYEYQSSEIDVETRQRLEFDGKKIKSHSKGSDAYSREFHTMPKLKVWIDRLDWLENFLYPVGTPSLGRSQDILKIQKVKEVEVTPIQEAEVSGFMIPFNSSLQIPGQLIQMVESFIENDEIGSGRTATNSKMFISVHHKSKCKIKINNLFETVQIPNNDLKTQFYLHKWN